MAQEEKFKVRLAVAQWPSRAPVYHKPDGQRFAQPNTLKLRAEHRYVVDITVSPAMAIKSMRIWGQTVILTALPQDRQQRDMTRYTTVWYTSGYDVNQNKTRTHVPLVLEFSGEGEAILLSTVQCKVYSGDGDGGHYTWGQALHSIDLDCKLPFPDAAFVDVIRDKFVSRRTS